MLAARERMQTNAVSSQQTVDNERTASNLATTRGRGLRNDVGF